MLDSPDGLATDAAPNQSWYWEEKCEMETPRTHSAVTMTWLERYNALNAENAILSEHFSKGTLSPQQFAQLQGNLDQMAFLFAVYREAGCPDRNLPIEGDWPKG